ncbi:hypothetical protein FRC11_003461 [Ceratobasidium sp. 423]|nr:hypothetical protein FRC11_003461 [Ceratobasidium sp. 423]
MFWNTSRLNDAIAPNRAPNGITPADWTGDAPSFYYGNITPPYQTWAEMLLHGLPVTLGNPVGLPEESVMATTYLCPIYQVKPLGSLLTSVFVGSATMTMSVWSVWMFFTAFVAKKMVPPRVQCLCSDCEKRQAEEEERARNKESNSAKTGLLAELMGFKGVMRGAKPTSRSRDQEYFRSEPLEWGEPLYPGGLTHSLGVMHTSYPGVSSTGEKGGF